MEHNVSIIRRFQITQEEAQGILGSLQPDGIYWRDARENCLPDLYEALLRGKYFQHGAWHDSYWVRTEFVVVGEVEGRRIQKLRKPSHGSVSMDWWLDHLLSQLEPAQPSGATLGSSEAISLVRILRLSYREAVALKHLLKQLRLAPLTLQVVQAEYDAQLIQTLLAVGILELHESTVELVADFHTVAQTAFEVKPARSAREPAFNDLDGAATTSRSWEARLKDGIQRAKQCNKGKKKPAEAVEISVAIAGGHKYTLEWEILFTWGEAQQFSMLASGASQVEIEDRLCQHLLEAGYCTPSPEDNYLLLDEDMLNRTSFSISDEDDPFNMRISPYRGGGGTSKSWKDRFAGAIKRARKRHRQTEEKPERLVKVANRFALSAEEGVRLLLLASLNPFTPGEMYKVLGATLVRDLSRYEYIFETYGYLNTGKLVGTRFVVVGSVEAGHRCVAIPEEEAEQRSDIFWLEDLREQLGRPELPSLIQPDEAGTAEVQLDSIPSAPASAAPKVGNTSRNLKRLLNLEYEEGQRLRYLFRVTGDTVPEVRGWLGDRLYNDLLAEKFLLLDFRGDESVVRLDEDKMASTSIAVYPAYMFNPELRVKTIRRLKKKHKIVNHWTDRLGYTVKECRRHMRKAGETVPEECPPASMVQRNCATRFLVTADEGKAVRRLVVRDYGVFPVNVYTGDFIPAALLRELGRSTHIYSDGMINIPLWQATWFVVAEADEVAESGRVHRLQGSEGPGDIDGMWWIQELCRQLDS